MPDFKVYYDSEDYCGVFEVYAIDNVTERFLVTTSSGKFLWVDIRDCMVEEENRL